MFLSSVFSVPPCFHMHFSPEPAAALNLDPAAVLAAFAAPDPAAVLEAAAPAAAPAAAAPAAASAAAPEPAADRAPEASG